ncbi:ArsR/SmtB family transcription factor [Halalkalibacter akibai]|uniref:Transcriptional regulator n=1 Tax=Halalkalibacter akibai (strain ATCC 43226 / DSM 21942 / CIP 109018 / JCM 9157 / 1139) TaxID=1236973 RepID=W4R1M2_HALA3|nr:metalloregulator ArsR/SmtB family transcription factor [Halalkalibacter akibai]GAE37424.1 transcriptional regulator [Halalkalibacter akibai JCM 9157]
MAAEKYDVFQAIADPTRREVLRLLANQELAISEITAHFSISRTAVAKHLKVLSEASLVSGKKVGREKIYQLHPEPLTEVKQWLAYYEQFWNNKLSILKHVVENDEENRFKGIETERE